MKTSAISKILIILIIPCSTFRLFAQDNVHNILKPLKNTTQGIHAHLDINNVDAIIASRGPIFCDDLQYAGGFEFPKGSGKQRILTNNLWVGGRNNNNVIRFSGGRYNESDFRPGPYAEKIDPDYAQRWEKVWKLSRQQILEHIRNFASPGYVMPDAIRDWPAHGNPSLGQSDYLAPFIDTDGDQRYSPENGDYPNIRGDQAVFFIFNDIVPYHDFSFGYGGMGLEILGMAYAFNCPEEELFYNGVFVHYDIYNRSDEIYSDTYLGLETGFEVCVEPGSYLQCDVERNAVYVYPAVPNDSSQLNADLSTIQSMVILSGPMMDPDQLDNPRTDVLGHQLCDYSVNGKNFGDGIPDNERFGLTAFYSDQHYSNSWFEPYEPFYYAMVYPVNPPYHSQVLYGGNGLLNAYGPHCRFMFPGDSDSLNWGTGCVPPNGQKEWTFETAGLSPSYNRNLSSMGPFTFHPGDHQELDVLYYANSNYTGSVPYALNLARRSATLARIYFDINETACGGTITSVQSMQLGPSLSIVPNPAKQFIRLQAPIEIVGELYRIINTAGQTLQSGTVPSDHLVMLDNIAKGVYFVEVQTGQHLMFCRMIRQ